MPPSILLTGASGYLGGTILSQLLNPSGGKAILSRSAYNKIYCLVRNDAQADLLKKWVEASSSKQGGEEDGGGIEPIVLDYLNVDEAERVLREKEITVVFYLIDAFSDKGQRSLIEALGKVRSSAGGDVHFLHTTGAKIFSSHTGTPTDRPLPDDDPEMYDIQKKSKAPLDKMQVPVDTNNVVIELCEKYDVKSYIFAPCIVYGKGEGFGNPISIQTKAIVQCAKALRRVYAVDEGEPVSVILPLAIAFVIFFRRPLGYD
jgi:nucleoside-diphosphate-sugar epimerase